MTAQRVRRSSGVRLARALAAALVLVAGCAPGPTQAGPSSQQRAIRTVKDVQYSGGEDDPDKSGHLLDLYLPDGAHGPTPLVIWTMGSGFTAPAGRTMGDLFANELVPHGYAVAAVAVRGSAQARFPAQRDDTLAAVAFLRRGAARYGLDPDRFAYIGHSSGGWSAAVAGLEGTGESAVQAAIALSPPTDLTSIDKESLPDAARRIAADPHHADSPGLRDFDGGHDAADSPEGRFLGGRVSEHPDRAAAASPVSHVAPGGPPFLIVHGTEDEYVPFAQGAALYHALKDAGRDVEFVTLPGASHEDAIPPWPPERVENATATRSTAGRAPDTAPVRGDGWDVVRGFLDEHLRR